MRTIFFLLILALSLNVIGQPSQHPVPESLKEAFKKGNVKEISKFFDLKIELAIFDDDDILVKKQAEIKLNDFFLKYKPQNFIIVFEGGKGVSQYAIGKLVTNNGEFRITMLLQNDKLLQLRIEAHEN